MPYPNEHSCHLKDSDQYDRIRRVNCDRKHEGKCIDVLYGVKEGKSEEQAYRYDKEIWTEAAARNHCEDAGGTFEAAAEEEDRANMIRFSGNIPPKPWYRMQSDEDSAEIEIFDEIGGWFGVEVSQFKKDFDEIKNKKSIKVLINSPGGYVFDGMAIYNILAAYKSKITTEIIGIAASIASVIALAGKTRNICQGTYFMIHDPYGFCMGPAEDMRKMAENLEKITGQIANIYARNSMLDKDDILQKMHEETWFTDEEAIEAGFADKIVDYGEMAAMAFDIAKFHNVPERMKTLAARKPETKTVPESDPEPEPEMGGTQMPENKESDDKAKIVSLETEVAELKAKVENEQEKVKLILSEKQDLAKELADLKAKISKEEKEQVIEEALSKGKITPKNRQKWEEAFDKDPEGTKILLETQDPVVDLSIHGTGTGGTEDAQLSEEDLAAAKLAGMTPEEYRKYSQMAEQEVK